MLVAGRLLPISVLICATIPAWALDLGVGNAEIGPLFTSASSRIGEHVDWGRAECGEPKYLKTVCVWELGSHLSLTSNELGSVGQARWAVVRWQRPDLADTTTRRVFEQTCRSLIAGLRPAWPAAKVSKFTSSMIGSAREDHEVRTEGITFAFYTWPEALTCEAQPVT